MNALLSRMTILLIAGCILVATSPRALADAPPPAGDITVSEHLGAEVPASLPFLDHRGHKVTIGEYFDGETPVVLVLAYVRCASLCNLVLRGVADAVRHSQLALGDDFRVVTVSIDPRETATDSESLREALLQLAGKSSDARWDYLTGDTPAIDALARTLGFAYHWDARTQQYAHPAVVFVLSGKGQVMRYLYGIRFSDQSLDIAIAGAARGEAVLSATTGGPLSCFRFDPALRAHWQAVARYFAVGGLLLILIVGGGIAFLIHRERARS